MSTLGSCSACADEYESSDAVSTLSREAESSSIILGCCIVSLEVCGWLPVVEGTFLKVLTLSLCSLLDGRVFEADAGVRELSTVVFVTIAASIEAGAVS